MKKQTYSIEVGGKTITAEFNDIADQANGSVLVSSGNTVVLATAVMAEKKSSSSYFPLRVDYEERFYAAGQILGSRYMRREGRPSEEAVLSGRIVDRTIRPLFDQRMRHEVQVVITILSIGEHDPDILAVNAASLALGTSNIPWGGPVSAVRVGGKKNNGDFEINPRYNYREADDFEIDVLVCGKEGRVNMVEIESHEVGEEKAEEALEKALGEIGRIEAWQRSIINEMGKEKRTISIPHVPQEVKDLFEKSISPILREILFETPGKGGIKKLKEKWGEALEEELSDADFSLAHSLLDASIDEAIHVAALDEDRRQDGRALDEVRPLFAQAGGISETLHGSGLFYRGGTHVLSVLTLGGPEDSLVVEGMEVQEKRRFLHHYNFPPFSAGETGRVGGFNRRMIGHGALAEKALLPVIPPREDFPYTIRVVSEALASNGSTSMGSVCGSSLALMDAGVPISRPVAGIAIGLMVAKGEKNKDKRINNKYKLLTDIQGPEDHHGDMDFKVAGTREGITAVQMDVKVDGVSAAILSEAFAKARDARLQILDEIEREIAEPRKEISRHAPHIVMMAIKEEQIGLVIGGGGKTVNEIRDLTGTEISIEDDGTVFITGKEEGAAKAQRMIGAMTREYLRGERFEGEIIKITDFGAFVKIGYNTAGLVHISEIAPFRIESVGEVLHAGEKIPVVIKNVDERGRINLSLKDADPDFAKKKLNR